MSDGLRLVRQARGVLPDGLALILCPKGKYRVPEEVTSQSALAWSGEILRWKVVELWTLSAEELLAAPDVAVALWATLAKYDGSPEVLLQRCRDRIDRESDVQRANLLAVTQVYTRLNFNRPEWLDILGGRKALNESPLIQELLAESEMKTQRDSILALLEDRFGTVSPTVTAGLAQVQDKEKLRRLLLRTANCPSLQAFEESVRQELPTPPPPSTRIKRRSRKPPS